jgi:hypothetical protein
MVPPPLAERDLNCATATGPRELELGFHPEIFYNYMGG